MVPYLATADQAKKAAVPQTVPLPTSQTPPSHEETETVSSTPPASPTAEVHEELNVTSTLSKFELRLFKKEPQLVRNSKCVVIITYVCNIPHQKFEVLGFPDGPDGCPGHHHAQQRLSQGMGHSALLAEQVSQRLLCAWRGPSGLLLINVHSSPG